jgi:3-hydroxybutyryl-CoA dehydratase
MNDEGQLYFDDFELGDRFASPPRSLSDAHFVLFAGITGDNHPIHYDDAYARQTRFGARVAHGLLVMATTALGASAVSHRLQESMIAFVEQGGRFVRPVLIGDTVHAAFAVTGLEPKRDGGLLRLAVTIRNQRDEVVLEGHHAYLLRSR